MAGTIPIDAAKIVIIGSNGQLGGALQKRYPTARAVNSSELDITNPDAVARFDWSTYDVVINAAAYTNVDGAETDGGRVTAWQVNAVGSRNLAAAAIAHDHTLIHISTDYVFDGRQDMHAEDEPFSPLGVYGQTKAAGDIAVSLCAKQYLLRTAWVVGDGNNFVRAMLGLGAKGISPHVVADQYGRPTFTTELVRIIDHLLTSDADYGTYNATNDGDTVSWADIARQVYHDAGYTDLQINDTTAEQYFAGKVSSPRPTHSSLDLSKLIATGFEPRNWRNDMQEYIKQEQA